MTITHARAGAALGAAAIAGVILHSGLPSDLDTDFAVFCLIFMSIGALIGLGVGLALQHIAQAPRVLARPALFLVPVSLLIVWSHWQERRAVPEMLARADSVHGVVLGENVFGNLIVLRRNPDGFGRMIAPRKHAHRLLGAGDSIRIYAEGKPPYRVLDVWPPGPDVRATVRLLFWLWFFGGVMLAGFGPRVSRRLAKPLREREAAATDRALQPSADQNAR